MGHPDTLYTLLVIDDDKIFCDAIKDAFQTDEFKVYTAHNKRDGLSTCARYKIDVALLDQKLEDCEGHLLCPDILKYNDETRIIFVTAYPSFDNAVRAIKAGAHDYLSKPFEWEELRLAVRRAIEIMELKRVKRVESYRLSREKDDNVLIGNFGEGSDVRKMAQLAASVDSPALITGETGTGKNIAAKNIHYLGARKDRPFIGVNCAALPETLIEDELFGHEKGAFTDARATRKGLFEIAHGGTLFLDEIADLPIHLQSKLLGVLDEGKIRRLGGETFITVNVRIIAATNANLEQRIAEKSFRGDLYYRLSVLRIHIPPLRERPEDIRELCDFFIEKMRLGRDVTLPDSEMKRLIDYSWPGNVRELKNIIERSLLLHSNILYPSKLLDPSGFLHAEPVSPIAPQKGPGGVVPLEQVEKNHIYEVLDSLSFNLTRGARELGMSLSTLKRKVKKYGLQKRD